MKYLFLATMKNLIKSNPLQLHGFFVSAASWQTASKPSEDLYVGIFYAVWAERAGHSRYVVDIYIL